MPEPPLHENKSLTWPYWPLKLRTSSSQEEGGQLDFSVITTAFEGDGRVEKLRCERIDWTEAGMERIVHSQFEIGADLILLAMGFTGTPFDGTSAGIEMAGGVIRAGFGDFATSRDRVFAYGDMRRGQSLMVWAIREGRDCAAAVHESLSATVPM